MGGLCGSLDDARLGGFAGAALGLKLLEIGGVLYQLPAEAGFLDAQVVQLAMIGEIGVGFDERRTECGILIIEDVGKFDAAKGVDPGFERGDAEQAPGGIGEGLGERGFGVSGGLPFGEEGCDVVFVGGGIVGGKQHGAAGESRFNSIERRSGFAFGAGGASAELSVRAVGDDAGFGNFSVFGLGSAGLLLQFALDSAADGTGGHRFAGLRLQRSMRGVGNEPYDWERSR
jgi:hypothetical protein